MNLAFMEKMQIKLNAVATERKKLTSDITTKSKYSIGSNKEKNITIESKLPIIENRASSINDISITVGDDPEVIAEQYITELGITSDKKRLQIFKRVARHLCSIQYRKILRHSTEKEELINDCKNQLERNHASTGKEQIKRKEIFLKEKIEITEKYEKKVNDLLSYSTNIEDILSKLRTENKNLEKKLKQINSQLALVKPFFKLLDTEEIKEEHVIQYMNVARDMKTRLGDIIEKNIIFEKQLKENALSYDRNMKNTKLQHEKFVDELQNSYELQLLKYKEEIDRIGKSEINIRKESARRITELTKKFQMEKENAINEIEIKHSEMVLKFIDSHKNFKQTHTDEITALIENHKATIDKFKEEKMEKMKLTI